MLNPNDLKFMKKILQITLKRKSFYPKEIPFINNLYVKIINELKPYTIIAKICAMIVFINALNYSKLFLKSTKKIQKTYRKYSKNLKNRNSK